MRRKSGSLGYVIGLELWAARVARSGGRNKAGRTATGSGKVSAWGVFGFHVQAASMPERVALIVLRWGEAVVAKVNVNVALMEFILRGGKLPYLLLLTVMGTCPRGRRVRGEVIVVKAGGGRGSGCPGIGILHVRRNNPQA